MGTTQRWILFQESYTSFNNCICSLSCLCWWRLDDVLVDCKQDVALKVPLDPEIFRISQKSLVNMTFLFTIFYLSGCIMTTNTEPGTRPVVLFLTTCAYGQVSWPQLPGFKEIFSKLHLLPLQHLVSSKLWDPSGVRWFYRAQSPLVMTDAHWVSLKQFWETQSPHSCSPATLNPHFL